MTIVHRGIDRFKHLVSDNPILIKELRIGLREKKVFIVQSIYLLIIGIVSFIYLIDISNHMNYYTYREVGRNFFKTLCIVQWFLVVLISPSLTSASISSEREKQTYDMLLVSLLNASQITIGKLAYAVSHIFLLLTASLPLVAMVFFLGGVSPFEIIVNYGALLLWGVIVSSMALFFSSRESRSAVATNQAYGVVILGGIFVVSIYMEYVWTSGLFIGGTFKMPDLLGWLALYFNIIWAFLFMFYKTAKNIYPKARHILGLHRLFIIGFLINGAGVAAIIFANTYNNYYYTGYQGYMGADELGGLWMIFTLAALFFMGNFLNVEKCLSIREQEKIEKSLTRNPVFFPAYFTGIAVLLTIFSTFAVSTELSRSIISLAAFASMLIALLSITNSVWIILKKKYKIVFIYYPIFFLINIVPLLSWLLTEAMGPGGHYGRTPSFFSLIFLSPIYTMLGLWENNSDFADVGLAGADIPTAAASIAAFIILTVLFKFIASFLEKRRNNNRDEDNNTGEGAASGEGKVTSSKV